MKYKIGDKVRIKSLEYLKSIDDDEKYRRLYGWSDNMYNYAGKIATIFSIVNPEGYYSFKEYDYTWAEDYLEDIDVAEDLKEKYKEIFRLKEMLDISEIPYHFAIFDSVGFQLCYPSSEGRKRVVSVIEHDYSYGSENDLLEIKGLLTKEEQDKGYDVLGNLTAEEVFERIQMHYYGLT